MFIRNKIKISKTIIEIIIHKFKVSLYPKIILF